MLDDRLPRKSCVLDIAARQLCGHVRLRMTPVLQWKALDDCRFGHSNGAVCLFVYLESVNSGMLSVHATAIGGAQSSDCADVPVIVRETCFLALYHVNSHPQPLLPLTLSGTAYRCRLASWSWMLLLERYICCPSCMQLSNYKECTTACTVGDGVNST